VVREVEAQTTKGTKAHEGKTNDIDGRKRTHSIVLSATTHVS